MTAACTPVDCGYVSKELTSTTKEPATLVLLRVFDLHPQQQLSLLHFFLTLLRTV